MDPGIAAALIGVVGAAVVASVGGTVKVMRAKAAKVVTTLEQTIDKREQKIEKLEQAINLLEKAVDVKDDVIADIRSQRDRLQITAEIQDKFFNQLPPTRRNSGD